MDVFESKTYIEYLKSELERRLGQNSSYSLRAFARDLQISPGNLSEIVKGKRPLSKKNAQKIAGSLGLNPIEEEAFLALPQESKKAHNEIKERKEIDLEYFKLLENWYHFAILNLLETKPKPLSAEQIAKRLGIKVIEAKLALDRLVHIGLVLYDQNNQWTCVDDFVETPTDIPSMAIKRYHQQILNKAIAALIEQSPEEREISGIGMAIDSKNLKAIKKDIDEFQNQLIEKYSGVGNPDEVYQFETALFKLSKR